VSDEVSCLDRVYPLAVTARTTIRVRFFTEQQGRALSLRACDGVDVLPRQLLHSGGAAEGRWSD
jgi:hypothetical protein